MTAGYDEWVAARTPSLLAFATALVDDPRAAEAAEAAVARSLGRLADGWSRVSRDDPDLEARRLVVRAIATPRRAAAVLRLLEQRSDAEIADVLRCSESAARRHLERGLAELAEAGRAGTGPSTREHLVARAGSAPTQLLTRAAPVAHRAPSRRRHRASWLAGAAVLALVGGVAFVAHESRSTAGVIDYPKVAVPESWRYESYAGVELQVPQSWGWGSSPIRSDIFEGPGHLGSCGTAQAAVLSPADDSPYVSMLTPFAGHPAKTDDRCVPWGSDGSLPRGEAVWFASPLPVGLRTVSTVVAETRRVGAQRVTVFGPNAALRRQILSTAEAVDVDANGCPTGAVTRATAGPTGLRPDSMSVCLYSQDTGVATLLYSSSVPGPRAARYAAATATPGDQGSGCTTLQGDWVALGLHEGRATRWDVVNLGCGRIELARGRTVGLAPETVRDWAAGGITAYVTLPPGADRALAPFFAAPAG